MYIYSHCVIKHKKRVKPNSFLGLGLQSQPRTFASAPCTVRLDDERRRLVVEVGDEDKVMRQEIGGEVHEYPWVWLRDNCQCPECYEPISHCRIINLTEWELNVRPASVQVRLNRGCNIVLRLSFRILMTKS